MCYKEVGLALRSSLFAGLAELCSLPKVQVTYSSFWSIHTPLLSALIIQDIWQNLLNYFYMQTASLIYLCLLSFLNVTWAKWNFINSPSFSTFSQMAWPFTPPQSQPQTLNFSCLKPGNYLFHFVLTLQSWILSSISTSVITCTSKP